MKTTHLHPWTGITLFAIASLAWAWPQPAHGAPTVRFTEAASTVSEGQGFKRLYVQASPALASELVVQLGVQFGTGSGAARASDFINCAGPCAWVPAARIPAGQTDGYYDLPIVNDTLDEFQETATFTIIGNSSSYTIGSPSAHLVTILPDPSDLPPSVSFLLVASSVTEGARHWVDAQLSGPTGKGVTVNWARAASSTATSPGDFTPVSGTVTFPADELIYLTRSFTLDIAADGLAESAETAVLNLSSPANASLGAITTHTVTIHDLSDISWAAAVVNLPENAGTASITLNISPPSPVPITVDISRNTCCDPAASASRDHNFQNLNGFLIPANTASIGVPVPILDDLWDELDERFQLIVKNPSSGRVIGSGSCDLVIQDNDPLPTVTFRRTTSTTIEGVTHSVAVELSQVTGKGVTINWTRTAASTATSPGDFTQASGSVSFAKDDTTLVGSIPLNIVPDGASELVETAVLTLSTPVNAAFGNILTHTVSIYDQVRISWAASALSLAEGVGTAQIMLDVVPPSPSPISVDIVETHCCGSSLAQGGRDFLFSSLNGFVIPANVATVPVPLRIVDDALDEWDENLQLFVKNPTSGSIGTPDKILITLMDNDAPPVVSFAAAASARGESAVGDPPQPNSAFIQIGLSAPSGREVRVPWSVLPVSTATRPADYDFSSGNPVGQDFVFPPGVQNSIIVINPIVPDFDYEPNETVLLELGTPVNATLGTERRHTLTIEDDDNVVWLLPQSEKASGASPVGHRVRFRKAAPGILLKDINQAEALLSHPLPHAEVAFEVLDQVAAINYVDATTDPAPQGYFGGDRDIHAVPGTPTFAAGDVDDFAIESSGYLAIPEDGHWTFTVRSDDGFRLRLGANEAVVMEFIGGRGPADSSVTVHVPRAGLYRYRLTYFEVWLGAQVEFFARGPGQPNNTLVGSGGTIAVTQNIDDPPVLDPELAGFTPAGPGHHVTFYKSALWLDTLDKFLTLLNTYPASITAEGWDRGVGTINYLDAGGDGYFTSGNRAVANPPLVGIAGYPDSFNAAGDNDFGLRATGYIRIPQAGIWNFGVHSDDGFRLRMGRNLEWVSHFAAGRAPAATEARVCVPAPGYYRYELLYFQGIGGAEVEFYASGPGQPTPQLVGDPAGVLRVYQSGSETLPAPVSVTPEPPDTLGANPGHRVRFRKAAPGVLLYDTHDGEALLNHPVPHAAVAFDLADDGVSVINYVDGATDLPPQGVFPRDRDLHEIAGAPRFAPGNVDDYAMKATGWLEVPTAGLWRFSVFSDDGFRLRMGAERTLVMEFIPGRAPAESLAVVNVPQAGLYPYELIFVEEAGNSQVEFFARPPDGADELVGTPGSALKVFQNLASPPCVELPSGLIAWWKADGDARDVYELFPGTPSGGAGFSAGRVGQAFNLDGVDDYFQAGSATGLKVTGTQLTLVAWVYPSGVGSPTRGGVILSKEGEFFLVRRPDGRIEFSVANTTPGWTGWTGVDTGVLAPLNTWTHLALVYEGATAKLYANGVLLHTRAGTGAIGDGQPVYNDLRIGNRQQPGFDSPFHGRIDEVAVFKRDLTAAEVQAVYTVGSVGWCVPPSMRVVRGPTGVEVRWPYPSTGFQLQATDRPHNLSSWTGVPSSSWLHDTSLDEWLYRDPAAATAQSKVFFRLSRP